MLVAVAVGMGGLVSGQWRVVSSGAGGGGGGCGEHVNVALLLLRKVHAK
jgi:hypothetical protein